MSAETPSEQQQSAGGDPAAHDAHRDARPGGAQVHDIGLFEMGDRIAVRVGGAEIGAAKVFVADRKYVSNGASTRWLTKCP